MTVFKPVLPAMQKVQSSAIAEIGHDGAALYVRYTTGGVHRFTGVPASALATITGADSKGKALGAILKYGQFKHEKIG